MWEVTDISGSMAICKLHGLVLREQRPDLLPYDFETPTERELWSIFYEGRK